MADKPKVEFGDKAEVLKLSHATPASDGESKYGDWWLWGCTHDGEEKMFFTTPTLQGQIYAASPEPGLELAIQKGAKGTWKTWTKNDYNEWEEVVGWRDASRAAGKEASAPPDTGPPPPGPQTAPPPMSQAGPASSPPKATTPQKAVQGLSAHEALAIYADLMPRCLQMLFGHRETQDIGETEQARMLATSIFIGITNDRSSTPKGYSAAPDAVSQVTQAFDGEPPPPSDADAPSFEEDPNLPF